MKIAPMEISLRLSSDTPKGRVGQALRRDLAEAIFEMDDVQVEVIDEGEISTYRMELFVFTADELDELLTQHELCLKRGERVEL